MYITFILLAVVLLFLLKENVSLNKSVSNIPVRILVNGTRGKSTVVKYIAEILRTNEYRTSSKITGVIPTFYTPDFEEQVIKRRGGARVTEQFKIIKKAADLNSDALVLECMSINPELQKLESRIFKPTFYVITNIREDHIEEMGISPEDWIDSICSAIPNDTIVLTSEREYLSEIIEYSSTRSSKVIHVDSINSEEIKIGSNIIQDNFKIALLVAEQLGLCGDKFITSLQSSSGEENISKYKIDDSNIRFINAFDVNDVESAEYLFEKLNSQKLFEKRNILIFNSRADRPIRTIKFAEWMSKLDQINNFIITGDHHNAAKRALVKRGVDRNKIQILKEKLAGSIVDFISPIVKENTSVIGIGNIKGSGFKVIDSFNKLEKLI